MLAFLLPLLLRLWLLLLLSIPGGGALLQLPPVERLSESLSPLPPVPLPKPMYLQLPPFPLNVGVVSLEGARKPRETLGNQIWTATGGVADEAAILDRPSLLLLVRLLLLGMLLLLLLLLCPGAGLVPVGV